MIIEHYMICYFCKHMKYFDRHSDLIMCRKFGILHGTRYSCILYKNEQKPLKEREKKHES